MSDTTPFADKILVAHEITPGASQRHPGRFIIYGIAEDTLILLHANGRSTLIGPQRLIHEAVARADAKRKNP